jgi:hypothetical protein
MTRARIAAAGTWVLERAGLDDAVTGDLSEQLLAHGSSAWYCRQALMAVALHWGRTLLEHKWLAARAIATGWVVWAALFVLRLQIGQGATQHEWLAAGAAAAIRYGNWFVIGWTIGNLHRPYHGSMVLAYAVFMLLMSTPAVSHLVISTLGHPSYVAPSPAMVVFATVSLIAGGLMSASSMPTAHRTPTRQIAG